MMTDATPATDERVEHLRGAVARYIDIPWADAKTLIARIDAEKERAIKLETAMETIREEASKTLDAAERLADRARRLRIG